MFWFLLGVAIVVLGGFILIGAIKLLLAIIAGIINIIGAIFFDRDDWYLSARKDKAGNMIFNCYQNCQEYVCQCCLRIITREKSFVGGRTFV